MEEKEEFTKFETLVLAQNERIISLLKTIVATKENNDFEISTLHQASLILKCSIPTLRKAIKNNTLVKELDYRSNGAKKYLFSLSALERIKGKI